MATPALLLTPDQAGELVFPTDEHRRALARCNPGFGITFSVLLERLAADPYTFGIDAGDSDKLSGILADLVADGDVTQNVHGVWEATPEGWFKITNIKAGKA